MAFVLALGGGAPRGYVRDCPPEEHFAYTSDVSQAVRFPTEAAALAYLTEQHPILRDGQLVGEFTRQSDGEHHTINIGDL